MADLTARERQEMRRAVREIMTLSVLLVDPKFDEDFEPLLEDLITCLSTEVAQVPNDSSRRRSLSHDESKPKVMEAALEHEAEESELIATELGSHFASFVFLKSLPI